ncbi:MarR family transcriptional regulator [Pseudorhodobacter turbinis]|uniref:MarR family transcriptional regulator n=1 Tax=Pseudorhodobacter turbinis TaxID=2500533 RepID=A0A4P8EC24_9RHOB|nr:MarR family transcriptional regulator [Pseudorhodobacter turbinis]QCO54391.1 MarR family transcriptional regulator [Pseudorhodobacter turbinis]
MNSEPTLRPVAPPQSDSKQLLRVWLQLLKVDKAVQAELRERLRTQFATTLPRFDVMSALYRRKNGLKMSELSRLLMVSNGNVTGIVDRLTTDGLILREAVPGDRRAARARLTAKGRTEFKKQATAHEAWVAELLGGLDKDNCSVALQLLTAARATAIKDKT